MRILQAPRDVVRQTILSVQGLNEIGHTAKGFFKLDPHRGWQAKADYYFESSTTDGWKERLSKMRHLAQFALEFDVFHYHTVSILSDYRDARLFRKLGKVVTVEFWGTDTRIPSVEMARNPYLREFKGADEGHIHARLGAWSEITGGHVVIVDDSFKVFFKGYFDQIHVVRQRVDTRQYTPSYPDPEKKVPLIVHAPSHRGFKGSEHLQRAVERLQAKGLRFEYRELIDLPNAELMRICADADLVVDQLQAGSHGVYAVEMMALGKPVLCYIHPELLPTYPEGFPIINANPDTIEAVLEEWIQRPEERHRLGVQAREYAERVHDCRVVARNLLAAYEKIGEAQR